MWGFVEALQHLREREGEGGKRERGREERREREGRERGREKAVEGERVRSCKESGLSPAVYVLQDVPDIRRIKWTQKWIPRYFYQHIYVPMLYCFVSACLSSVHGS